MRRFTLRRCLPDRLGQGWSLQEEGRRVFGGPHLRLIRSATRVSLLMAHCTLPSLGRLIQFLLKRVQRLIQRVLQADAVPSILCHHLRNVAKLCVLFLQAPLPPPQQADGGATGGRERMPTKLSASSSVPDPRGRASVQRNAAMRPVSSAAARLANCAAWPSFRDAPFPFGR